MKTSSILIAATAFLVVAHANAITIGVNPSTQTVEPGDAVSVEIGISGLGAGTAPSIGEFDLNLSFDSTLLSYNSATFGDPILGDQLDLFGFGSLTDVMDNGAGVLNLFELSFDWPSDLNDLQADAFTMVTVNFDALAVESSGLTLTLNSLGDALGDPLDATLESGSVTVEPAFAPEPVTAGLLALGLVGLGVGCRRLLCR